MLKVLWTVYFALRGAFKSRSRLEAENAVLRHQLNIAQRKRSTPIRLSNFDRAFLVWLSQIFPTVLGSVQVVRPETVTAGIGKGFGVIGVGGPQVCGSGAPRSTKNSVI